MAILEPRYLQEPFCEIYVEEKGGTPFLPTSRERFNITGCTIMLDAKKINSAALTVQLSPDNADLELNAIHEGVTVYIRMGYRDIIFPPPLPPFDRIVFKGILERQKAAHMDNGNIRVDLRARAMAAKTNLGPVTRTYIKLTRAAIIGLVVAPFLGGPVAVATILFESMVTLEPNLKQINQTPFQFLKDLAKKWNCILHESVVAGKSTLFFVDNNEKGQKIIDSAALQPLGYELNWRDSGTLKPANLTQISFSGLAAAKQSQFAIKVDPVTGKTTSESVTVGEGDDATTWTLNESKVQAYIEQNGVVEFTSLIRNAPQQTIRDTFWDAVKGIPQSAGKGASPPRPTMGSQGHKAEFQLAQGDAFLEPNMTAILGGDIMGRYKNYNWRVMKVRHTWGPNGFQTAGTLGA
jgi:hypothetical protein